MIPLVVSDEGDSGVHALVAQGPATVCTKLPWTVSPTSAVISHNMWLGRLNGEKGNEKMGQGFKQGSLQAAQRRSSKGSQTLKENCKVTLWHSKSTNCHCQCV